MLHVRLQWWLLLLRDVALHRLPAGAMLHVLLLAVRGLG